MSNAEKMNKDQFYKQFSSVNRRINNLESRFGGVIGESHADLKGGWWNKKQKLLSEKEALRSSYDFDEEE
jgi:hypothetical protein